MKKTMLLLALSLASLASWATLQQNEVRVIDQEKAKVNELGPLSPTTRLVCITQEWDYERPTKVEGKRILYSLYTVVIDTIFDTLKVDRSLSDQEIIHAYFNPSQNLATITKVDKEVHHSGFLLLFKETTKFEYFYQYAYDPELKEITYDPNQTPKITTKKKFDVGLVVLIVITLLIFYVIRNWGEDDADAGDAWLDMGVEIIGCLLLVIFLILLIIILSKQWIVFIGVVVIMLIWVGIERGRVKYAEWKTKRLMKGIKKEL